MSDTELHNSYKCYDSIPTPPDGLKLYNGLKPQLDQVAQLSGTNNLIKSPSLDSLANSSEQDKESSSDEISDTDSLCELRNITSCEASASDPPRKSDIEQLIDVEPQKEVVRNAYLEKSHKSCDYENCSFKKNTRESGKHNENSPVTLPTPVILKTVRRNSITNLDANRMETILEEPGEAKMLTVKEILARFETMRETTEVISLTKTILLSNMRSCPIENFPFSSQSKPQNSPAGGKVAANMSIEKTESSSNGHHQNRIEEFELKSPINGVKRNDDSINYQQNNFVQHKSSITYQESNMQRQEDSSPTQTSVVKHSLLQFALQHFRYE